MSRPVPERTIVIGDNEPVTLRCDHRCMRVLERQFGKSIFSYIQELDNGISGTMYSSTAELAFALSARHRYRTEQEHMDPEEWMDKLPVAPEAFAKIGVIVFGLVNEAFGGSEPGNAPAPVPEEVPAQKKRATRSIGDVATT